MLHTVPLSKIAATSNHIILISDINSQNALLQEYTEFPATSLGLEINQKFHPLFFPKNIPFLDQKDFHKD
jgi:hypothetical protein